MEAERLWVRVNSAMQRTTAASRRVAADRQGRYPEEGSLSVLYDAQPGAIPS
jgi:hypothetical protein